MPEAEANPTPPHAFTSTDGATSENRETRNSTEETPMNTPNVSNVKSEITVVENSDTSTESEAEKEDEEQNEEQNEEENEAEEERLAELSALEEKFQQNHHDIMLILEWEKKRLERGIIQKQKKDRGDIERELEKTELHDDFKAIFSRHLDLLQYIQNILAKENRKSAPINNECQISNISMETEEQFKEPGNHIIGPKISSYSNIQVERNRKNSEVEGLQSQGNKYRPDVLNSEQGDESIEKRSRIQSAEDNVKLKIGLTPKAAGSIIGRKGAALKKLIDKTGAKLKILSNIHIDTEDRIFLISGRVHNVKNMFNAILEKINSVKESTEEIEKVKIIVSNRIVGTLTGKRFIYLKQIEQETGVRIKIAPKSSESMYSERPLTLIGILQCIKNASKIILQKILDEAPLANFKPKSRTNDPSLIGVNSSSENANAVMSVEQKLQRLIDILKTNSSLPANVFSEL